MQNRRKAAVLAVAMAAGLSFGGRAARATSGSASFSDLVNFTGYAGAAPGDYPNAGLAADAQGNLYGTTYEGGADGYGTVYKLAAGTHAFSELASFTGNTGAEPGLNPGNGPLVLYNGFFYGGTQIGGYQSGGVIYKINASNGAFSSVSSGQNPYAGLAVDSTGHLYGGTDFGGAYGDGSVFKYSPASNSTSGVSFNYTNGTIVFGTPILDSAGNVYGVTNEGGLYNGGTIFKINSAFNSISVLANFNTSMGVNAGGKLLMDAAGNLYGVTEFGGQFNHGTVFELPAGSGTIVPLASFPNGGDNNTSLIEDPLGNLFGVSSSGGANGLGEIYELPAGSNTIVPVYTFTSTASGNGPIGDLYVDASGNFYGTADGGPNSDGLVFELTNTGYGVAVPEPRGTLVAATALLVLLGRRNRPEKAHRDAARM